MKERKGKEIRKWMIDVELRAVDISREVEVNTPLVGKTIDGDRNNRKVLRYLVAKGCPVAVMDLPQDIKDEFGIKEAA